MNNNVRSSGGHLTKETEGPPSATCKITKITANNDSTIEKGRDLHGSCCWTACDTQAVDDFIVIKLAWRRGLLNSLEVTTSKVLVIEPSLQ